MRTDDLKLINDLGQALYARPELAQSRAVETLAAVSSLDRLSAEQSLETATHLLFQRAEKEARLAESGGLHQPFYRLSARERFVLALLKSGRFSYARISKMLSVDVPEVERIAWAARTRLATSPEIRAQAPHPPGTTKALSSCPEYDGERPWTQRLLDDESAAQERVFLQNHSMACESCRRSLARAREFYYAIEALVPESGALDEKLLADVRRARLRAPSTRPIDMTFVESLGIFFERSEVRALVALLSVLAVYKLLT